MLIFGIALLGLFAGFAIAQGIGQPSVPPDAAAIVEDAPGGTATISIADFQRGLGQAAAQNGGTRAPKPGDDNYDELTETVLTSLLVSVWIEGLAEEMGISMTPAEVTDAFKAQKEQSFKTAAEYKKFLKTSHFTQADVIERVKTQALTTKIQEELTKSVPTPSGEQIDEYYEAAKASMFTTKPTRDVRIVVNKSKAKAEQAKSLLDKDDSPANWKKVVAKYSADPTSKAKGGLTEGLTNPTFGEPLDAAIFGASTGDVEGVVKGPSGYLVFEVEKTTPSEVQPLAKVKSQISSELSQQAQKATFAKFSSNFEGLWKSRTFCAAGNTIKQCANFKSSGHSPEAIPACYEAHPKGGLPKEGCPAPVFQLKPALPGTVSVFKPQGEPLAQRPQPPGLKPTAETVLTPPVG